MLANNLLKGHELSFKDFCNTLSGDSEYSDAQDFIKQAENVLRFAFNDLLSKVESTGKVYFSDELKSAEAEMLWRE